jgi:glycosyltransferase involved in cell wall biosynthesis
METKRIIAVHLLNDFSGSPLVLRQALEALSQDFEIHLYTSTPSGAGILSDIPLVNNHGIFYRWNPNKFITLLFFACSQFILFFRLLFVLRKNDTVYINTLLPFAAALAGKCRCAKVIYHVHEVSIKPPPLKSFLIKIAACCADKVIFVSGFVKQQFNFADERTLVVYNALPDSFTGEAQKTVVPDKGHPFTVLMLCSLKAYKGIHQFVELARNMPHFTFKLVLNASPQEAARFRDESGATPNCLIYPVQKDTAQFYKDANVVVNLSLTDQWLETFGMTILEAMYYSLPVIVPPAGGVTELVTNGVEGVYANAYNIQNLIDAITRLASENIYYKKLAAASLCKARCFSQSAFRNQIIELFKHVNQVAELMPAVEF